MALILTLRSAGGAVDPLPPPLRIENGSAVIGRAQGANLLLAHPLVSSRHCVVTGQGGSWQLQDTSTNGTYLNGRRAAGVEPLQHGDVIRIADIELAVTVEASGGAAWGAPRNMARDAWQRGGAVPPAPHTAPGARLMEAAGLSDGGSERLGTAGAALQAAVAGLTTLATSRSKARKDLKLSDPAAAANPILAGDPAALSKLLTMDPPAAAEAVNTASRLLEAHQRAALAAMQAAFKAALDQFSPDAIKLRARDDASAWKSYEKAFKAQDGFVDLFAQEFAKAYEQLSRG